MKKFKVTFIVKKRTTEVEEGRKSPLSEKMVSKHHKICIEITS